MKKTLIISAILSALPVIAFADESETADLSYFNSFIGAIGGMVSALIPILIGVALLVFFWGLIKYIKNPEFAEGRKIMVAGLVALFIMVSVWGIVELAQNILNVDSSGDVNSPAIPPTDGSFSDVIRSVVGE